MAREKDDPGDAIVPEDDAPAGPSLPIPKQTPFYRALNRARCSPAGSDQRDPKSYGPKADHLRFGVLSDDRG